MGLTCVERVLFLFLYCNIFLIGIDFSRERFSEVVCCGDPTRSVLCVLL